MDTSPVLTATLAQTDSIGRRENSPNEGRQWHFGRQWLTLLVRRRDSGLPSVFGGRLPPL